MANEKIGRVMRSSGDVGRRLTLHRTASREPHKLASVSPLAPRALSSMMLVADIEAQQPWTFGRLAPTKHMLSVLAYDAGLLEQCIEELLRDRGEAVNGSRGAKVLDRAAPLQRQRGRRRPLGLVLAILPASVGPGLGGRGPIPRRPSPEAILREAELRR